MRSVQPTPEQFQANSHAMRIPAATYRLQLHSELGFDGAGALVPYLRQLGVSDLYLSPPFRAAAGSSHGYDVVDHALMADDFGGNTAFSQLADSVHGQGMGILLDIVPNHMGVSDPNNSWWNDVLQNGPDSKFATFFDIDWSDRQSSAENVQSHSGNHQRLLLPVLGASIGEVLERGEFKVAFNAGWFHLNYFEKRFPISPTTWTQILQIAISQLLERHGLKAQRGDELARSSDLLELESIVMQLRNMSAPTIDRHQVAVLEDDGPSQVDQSERVRALYREQSIAARRLEALINRSSEVRTAIDQALKAINGQVGEPASFDELEQLIDSQHYRLAFWRVAADEVNYRRFFDVNELAAIRVELPQVFEYVHRLIGHLFSKGQVTGLRIDHPDGLLDPRRYLDELQTLYANCRPADEGGQTPRLYVVVEKILSGEEQLPIHWEVSGTTGYELISGLNRLLVDSEGVEFLRKNYFKLSGVHETAAEVVYQSKKRIIDDAMSSELHVLARKLHRISRNLRWSRDFTFSVLLRTLREVIACFPVYRTYVSSRGWDVDASDTGYIQLAIRLAKRRNPTMSWTAIDFVGRILLLQLPVGLSQELREELRRFVLKFQQVTGPITAKGTEDTAFYRYYPLVSLNEVGGELESPTLTISQFHDQMQRRSSDWPHALSATGTHDTKRGEDVRARLHVISEVAEEWCDKVAYWNQLNEVHLAELQRAQVPSANERYLLYQTLVGTKPLGSMEGEQKAVYQQRIVEYMKKGLREAKLNTSWANPSEEYERAVVNFITCLFDESKSSSFLIDLNEFVESISDAGYCNSLSQLVLKCTVPGLPDFYQGSEFWDFRLVDPDNRTPVDFVARSRQLEELLGQFAESPTRQMDALLDQWPSPRVKLFVTWRLLQLRQDFIDLFTHGAYIPLEVSGNAAAHVVAFMRRNANQTVVVAATRQLKILQQLGKAVVQLGRLPVIHWEDTKLHLPDDLSGTWRDCLSERAVSSVDEPAGTSHIAASELFGRLSIGVCSQQSK